jgi:hypothetical protein
MANFAKGKFTIKNKEKYVGKGVPTYRSGWEFSFMTFLDNNDHVLNWASECVAIPYKNPLTGKMSRYFPDFLVTYRQRDNTVKAELIEIKPKKQSVIESKMSNQARAIVAVNYAKWSAAQAWCKRNGLTFRVITEDDMFRNGKK